MNLELFNCKEITLYNKIKYGYEWNLCELNRPNHVPLFCNIYIIYDSVKSRIDTININQADIDGCDTYIVYPLNHYFNTDNTIICCSYNLSYLINWVNNYVLSNKGMNHIFNRLCEFDYYQQLRYERFTKQEIITLMSNLPDRDDDNI